MKRYLLALVLIPLLAIVQLSYKSANLEESLRWTIIPAKSAEKLFDQCSRDAPKYSKLIDLEAADYTAAFAKVEEKRSIIEDRIDNNLNNFTIQVTGFKSKDKKIYFNCFVTNKHNDEKDKWETTPVVKCDGSNKNWGMVYNLKTNQLTHLKGNGPVFIYKDNI